MNREPEAVFKVDTVRIEQVKTNPLGLAIAVTGKTNTPGWKGFALSPWTYVDYPADGIHDIDWIGMPPGGVSSEVIAPAKFEWTWFGFPEGKLKGVRIHAASNKVEARLG